MSRIFSRGRPAVKARVADPDRYAAAVLAAEPDRVVAAYRRFLGLPPELAVTAGMVARHWQVEREGIAAIRAAPPAERAAVAERAYTAVYRACPWLNAGGGAAGAPDGRFGHYLVLLGPARRVYEIGSGKGALISWLSRRGYHCVATEITGERGQALLPGVAGIAWHGSDGVHLERYEPAGGYEAVISSQLVEHLHPDDLAAHLAGVRTILAAGGRYILTTPHAFLGPADLSLVFGLPQPVCQHLKEYRYRELVAALRTAGFGRIRAFYSVPAVVTRRFPRLATAWVGEGYLRMLLGAEAALDALPVGLRRRLVRALWLVLLWRSDVSIVAETRPAAPDAAAT